MSKERNDDDPVTNKLCTARRETILERIDGMEKTLSERISGIKKAIYVSSSTILVIIAVLEVWLRYA